VAESSSNSQESSTSDSPSSRGLLWVAVFLSVLVLAPAVYFISRIPEEVLKGDNQSLVSYLWFPAAAVVIALFIYALIPVILKGQIVSVASIIGVAALGLSVYVAYTYPFDNVARGRALITIFLVLGIVSLALIVSLSAVLAKYGNNQQYLDKRLDVAKSVFATLVGVLGTVVGFYFGTAEQAGHELKIVDVQPSAISTETTGEIELRVTTKNGELPLKYKIELTDEKGDAVREYRGLAPKRTFTHKITREAGEAVGLKVTVRDKENQQEDTLQLLPDEWISQATNKKTSKDTGTDDQSQSAEVEVHDPAEASDSGRP